ncbi:Protein male abnormal [Trichinella spiralis]|uniref:Protein male abnormal n=1 Tax=Trichinella spiralis TaxID=6334 RepID=A0ABR3KIG8_TRISP
MNNSILKCYCYKCVATCIVAFILCVGVVCGQCPCEHGHCTANRTCRCDAGWVGSKCHRPCQDVYKACPYWEKEGRCVWTRKCIYNLKTIPPGLPLPPYLELLKQLIGEWNLNSDDSINYPVNFAKGGYNKVLRIMLTQVPLFDTPSLNYTGFARSKEDSNDIQEEKGFIWVRPAKSPTREVAYMITTNSGISMLQEGHLKNNYIQLHTVHDANHPYSRCEQPYLRNEHTFSWNDHQLTETFKDDSGRVHFKTYVKRVT